MQRSLLVDGLLRITRILIGMHENDVAEKTNRDHHEIDRERQDVRAARRFQSVSQR